MSLSARETALNCLIACEKQGTWSDGYLHRAMQQAHLDRRDAAFCTRLTFGVVQNRMLLDWYIQQFSTTPPQKWEPAIRNLIRMGLYQMYWLDRVPVHAAVYETVSLARKRSRNPKAAALVNAVLRAAGRTDITRLQPEDLSIRYSHPKWLVQEFARLLEPPEIPKLLDTNNIQPPATAQVNVKKISTDDLLAELTDAGVSVKRHPWLPDCLELQNTGNLEELKAFQEGKFYIQDAAARLAVIAADPKPGISMLDACAAPGGKSFAAALLMEDRGSILACDIHPRKKQLMEDGAARLGLTCIQTAVLDGKKFVSKMERKFDLVFVDAPCSGLGIIRKKPDIRYKDPQQLAGLPAVQRAIVQNTARYVRPGGVLLYATCTLLPRENEDIISWFLSEHSAFALETFSLPGFGSVPGSMTLWPHRHHTDGFFFAKLRNRNP